MADQTIQFENLGEMAIETWHQAVAIWHSGGWAMYAIAAAAFVMFAVGVNVYVKLLGKGYLFIREKTWRRWIENPEERRGAVGELMNNLTGAATVKDVSSTFAALRASEIAPIERDLRVMKVCVSAAPLLGLLGTVTGMLTTFNGMVDQVGNRFDSVVTGISEALITTQTGLVISIPALVILSLIIQRRNTLVHCIARLERFNTRLALRSSCPLPRQLSNEEQT